MRLLVFLLGLGVGACVTGQNSKPQNPTWHHVVPDPVKKPETREEKKPHVVQDHEWYVQAPCEPDRAPCPDEYPRPTEAKEDPTTTPSEAGDSGLYCPDVPNVDCRRDLRRDPDGVWW